MWCLLFSFFFFQAALSGWHCFVTVTCFLSALHCWNQLKITAQAKALFITGQALWQSTVTKQWWHSSPPTSGCSLEHAWKGSKVMIALGMNQVESWQIRTQKNNSLLCQIIIWHSNEFSKSILDALASANRGKKR